MKSDKPTLKDLKNFIKYLKKSKWHGPDFIIKKSN